MHIDNILSGIMGVVIGAVITYTLQNRLLDKQLAEQRRIASARLRLDLFDRRYKVFDAARNFLAGSFQHGFLNPGLTSFNLATSDAEFLFGSDVVDWLADVRKRAVELHTTKTLLLRPPEDQAELEKLANKENETLSCLIDQSNAITSVFAGYLGFAQIK
jgi:hypothetical protein